MILRTMTASALLVLGSIAFPVSAGAGTDLQALIDNAAPGSVLTIPSGTYTGGIRIEKPLTLEGVEWPVIEGAGTGSVITIVSPDVTIRGFVIRGSGISNDREDAGISGTGDRLVIENNRLEEVLFGIYLREAPDSKVLHNTVGAKNLEPGRRGDGIRLWECERSLVEGNQVADGRDLVLWYSSGLVVRSNRVTDGRYGLHFMYSDDVTVEGNTLAGNSVGAFLMYSRRLTFRNNEVSGSDGPSGYGLGLKDVDGVEVHGNKFVENRIGVYLDNSPTSPDVYQSFSGNVFAFNDFGVVLLPSVKRNIFWDNAFVDNREQVARQGDGVLKGNEWSHEGRGNYWSDYAGYDADQNGIGDLTYRIDDLFAQVTDTRTDLRLLSGTPAARVVDAAAEAFPTMRPLPKVEDTAPLLTPPMPLVSSDQPVGPLLLTGSALVGLALLTAFTGRRTRPARLRGAR